jgi:hypothetical protein
MAVRLSVLRAGRPLPPRRFLVLISVKGCMDPMARVRLEGLGQLKKSNDFIGNRTGDLSACSICLNQLRYRVPPTNCLRYNVNILSMLSLNMLV